MGNQGLASWLSPAVLLATIGLLGTPAAAAGYGYPLSMRLGAGINPANPADNFPYCFAFKSRPVPGTAGNSTFRTSLIRNRKDFLRELNVSAAASGTYTFFGGSVSGSLDERYSFASDTVTWTVGLWSDLGRAEIFDEEPLPFAAELLRKNSSTEFATRCGLELVTQERREASITAVFSASNLSTEQKNSLEARFSGQATAAVWNADVSTKFRSFVEEVSKSSRINVDVVTIGGGGAKDLAALFTDFGDLNQISSVLRGYAASLAYENARATSYSTTKMSRYGWKGNVVDFTATDVAMGDYYMIYRDTDAIKQRAYGLINGSSSLANALSDSQRDEMRKVYTTADALVLEIVNTAKRCRGDERKCVPASSFQIPNVKWPKIDPVGALEQVIKNVNCVQAASPIAADVAYLCNQRSVFRVFARWDRVAAVEVADRWQQKYTPLHGKAESMDAAYERYKNQMGAAALDEVKFLELVTGEHFNSIAEAIDRGWSSRDLSIDFLFGATSSNGVGLRTSLLFGFYDTAGARTERLTFMY